MLMLKNILFFSLLLVFVLLLYVMTSLSLSRYSFVRGVRESFKAENFSTDSETALKKSLASLAFLPLRTAPLLCREDMHIIHAYAGKICLEMVENLEEQGSKEHFDLLERAENHYRLAISASPRRLRPARGLAETVFQLEQAFAKAFPEKENPYNALPHIETLGDMGPNVVDSQLLIARYFDFKGMKDELFSTVEQLSAIFPPAAMSLRRESFYQPWLKPALMNGLDKAIKQGVEPKNACFAVARLMREDGDYEKALEYWGRGMKIKAHENTESNHLFFGNLLLENKKNQEADHEFKIALAMTSRPDQCFKNIYNAFKKNEGLKDFLEFAGSIRSKIKRDMAKTKELEMSIARARMELGFHALARTGLEALIDKIKDPDACYLMAIIAEKEKDWDAMEINIHKAIVLAPENCRYYNILARALSRQGKQALAGLEKKKARDCAKRKKK